MNKAAATTPKPNIYQIVTDRIFQSLKAGVIPWEKPWKTPTSMEAPSLATSARASPIAA
jgi:antirestriction protein ArdC